MSTQPSLLDLIAEAPASWPQVLRVKYELLRRAETYRDDARRLRAAPDADWPEAADVYESVADELAGIARTLTDAVDDAERAAVGE